MTTERLRTPEARMMRAGISFSDEYLARLGLTVLFEGQAKAVSAAMLRALEGLPEGEWVKLERVQFGQIMERLLDKAKDLDPGLYEQLTDFDALRRRAAEKRHIVVHASWGQSPGIDREPQGYDYGRQKLLSQEDVDDALLDCADLAGAARECAIAVAKLICEGLLSERPSGGAGASIHYNGRLVRL